MSKHADVETKVKKHLDAIMAIDGGWPVMLSILQVRSLQKRLRDARIMMGMTQAEVGEAMGVEQARVAELETTRYPDYRISTLARWARALGVELHLEAVENVVEEQPNEGSELSTDVEKK